jgi:23S rRNA (adenine-N6)-dimethyltransferase
VAGRRAAGARPPRARSQHFLRTSALAAELVRDAGIGADDLVLDLGAGTGRITAELAHAAARVVAEELDADLAGRLRGRWANVEVVHGDAALLRLPHEPFRVVANLPFSRTTDLLHLLLDEPRTPLTRADLVVEWGVALKRGLPWPSTLNGVLWGAFYETTVARRLPRSAFEPPPAVDAGVLVFRRRADPLIPAEDASGYRTFVASAFRSGVRSVAPARSVRRVAGRNATARELDAHQWAELFLQAGSRVGPHGQLEGRGRSPAPRDAPSS